MDKQVRRTRNRVIKLLLHGIVLDSMKHIDMLETMIDLLTGSVVPEAERDELGKELKRHIQVEKDSLDRLEGVIGRTEDKGVRFLLQNIASDERRHHTVLDQIISTLAVGENITDMDWWDDILKSKDRVFFPMPLGAHSPKGSCPYLRSMLRATSRFVCGSRLMIKQVSVKNIPWR